MASTESTSKYSSASSRGPGEREVAAGGEEEHAVATLQILHRMRREHDCRPAVGESPQGHEQAAEVAGSSPEVGSSRKNTCGCVNSSTAMLARLRCPPLKLPTGVAADRARSSVSSTASTLASIAARSVVGRHAEPRGVTQGRRERKVGVDDVVLWDVTDGVTDCGAVLCDVEAVVAHVPESAEPDAGEHLEQRRLAGAAAADDRDQLAWFDREGDVAQQRVTAGRGANQSFGADLHSPLHRSTLAHGTA